MLPALDAITLLFETHASLLVDSAAGNFVQAARDHFHTPTLEQPLRFAVLKLFRLFVRCPRWTRCLHGSTPEDAAHFCSTFVMSMEAEKDPRCLLVALETAHRVLFAFADVLATMPQGGDVLEELCDVTLCYFPITFTPPPNDPHGITRDMLADALQLVFTSTQHIARHVLPLLLEKLSSSMTPSKLDALAALRACMPAYGGVALRPFLAEIAGMLRQEIIHSVDAEVSSRAVAAVRDMSAVLSRGVESDGREW
jgi:hypothetical protein